MLNAMMQKGQIIIAIFTNITRAGIRKYSYGFPLIKIENIVTLLLKTKQNFFDRFHAKVHLP